MRKDGGLDSCVWQNHFFGAPKFTVVGHSSLSPPSSGDAWQLEDDGSEPERDPALEPRLSTSMDEPPFRSLRTRSFYMRKSLSVDNHLSSLSYSIHPTETKTERVKNKLRRQFVSTERLTYDLVTYELVTISQLCVVVQSL